MKLIILAASLLLINGTVFADQTTNPNAPGYIGPRPSTNAGPGPGQIFIPAIPAPAYGSSFNPPNPNLGNVVPGLSNYAPGFRGGLANTAPGFGGVHACPAWGSGGPPKFPGRGFGGYSPKPIACPAWGCSGPRFPMVPRGTDAFNPSNPRVPEFNRPYQMSHEEPETSERVPAQAAFENPSGAIQSPSIPSMAR